MVEYPFTKGTDSRANSKPGGFSNINISCDEILQSLLYFAIAMDDPIGCSSSAQKQSKIWNTEIHMEDYGRIFIFQGVFYPAAFVWMKACLKHSETSKNKLHCSGWRWHHHEIFEQLPRESQLPRACEVFPTGLGAGRLEEKIKSRPNSQYAFC